MSPLSINEILTLKQKTIFEKLTPYKKSGIMAGGTALAFQLRHRKSYDFDIFTPKTIPANLAWEMRKTFGKKIRVIKESENELTFLTPDKFKITFFYYPFKPLYKAIKTSSLPLFNWKDIAADKAYTIGRRPIYRDYIDIFFIVKKGHNLKKIATDAKKKFQGLFSEKLFFQQLIYFDDLRDFQIEFIGKKYQPREIKKFLEKEVKKYTKEKIAKTQAGSGNNV
jgi:hypothetical protein